jgi:hypothetical protein
VWKRFARTSERLSTTDPGRESLALIRASETVFAGDVAFPAQSDENFFNRINVRATAWR